MKDDHIALILVVCLTVYLFYNISQTNNKLQNIKQNINNNYNNDNYNNDNYNNGINYNKQPDTFTQLIKETHSMCPVMDAIPKISSCIHYPPLNRGFIISTCCKHCVEQIQKSFKNADNKYRIDLIGGFYYLVKNDEITQMVPECGIENIRKVIKIANTKMMD